MPCDYSIDAEHLLVRTYAWGDVTGEEMLSLQQRLADDPRSSREFSQLVDARHVSTFDGLLRCTAPVTQGQARHSSTAIVVSRAVPLGLAPLLDACRQHGDAEKPRVFLDLQDALVWLEVLAMSPATVAIAA